VHTEPTTHANLPGAPEPAFIRRLLVALTSAVVLVAVVANGAAYLGGVAFAQNVMQLQPTTAYVFGGVIELALAVVAAATFIEAYRLQPTAVFRTATWVLSGVSGAFGSLFEVMEYLNGHLTLPAALSAAGWRLFAPFLAAGLWELVIHLFCGGRHRAHQAAERRHGLLYRFFKAGEAEGLANGTWLAPLAAARARRAARAIAKHVPQAERDAELAAWLESARYGEEVRVQVATIAARTAQRMHADLVGAPADAPALQAADVHVHDVQPADVHVHDVQPADVHVHDVQAADVHVHDVQPADVHPAPADDAVQVHDVHVQPVPAPVPAQPVHDEAYEQRVAAAVQSETDRIRADIPATPAPRPARTDIEERRAFVHKFLQANRDASGPAVHKALLAAGHDVKLRTAYNDRDAVLTAMA
jgi:hypothetical protein